MKTLFIIAVTLLANNLFGQTDAEIKIFHRLVVLDAEDNIMVVKVENANVWVTPGFYQTQDQTIQNGLKNLASSYGIEFSQANLNGVFLLQRDINGKRSTSLRNVYTVRHTSGTIEKPTGIDEVRWVSVDEATELITFPHISVMVQAIMDQPARVRGGTLRQFKEDDRWQVEIIEAFYSF